MNKPHRWKAVTFLCFVCGGMPLVRAQPPGSSPARSTPEQRADHNPTNALCSADASVCVPRVTQNTMLTNPLDVAVTAARSVGDIDWELGDQTGQKLASGKASDDPNWDSDSARSAPRTFHLRVFVFVLPKAASGMLKVSPARSGPQGAPAAPPGVNIPVRFVKATSVVTVVVPKDYGQYREEVEEWLSSNGPRGGTAKSPFVTEHLTVMHVDDEVFASAAAAAEKASFLSPVPVRVLNFAVQGGTAYVDLSLNDLEDHWPGFSVTLAEVEMLLEKNLAQFPTIHKVVFAWPPGETSSLPH